ncbi:NUDIX domain-containing protein [Candidatus Micrarchaeota archaeon]|nr:NUDIX domain-containing protein [Candidatus Micrarchaeota archaeon]
MKKIPHDPNELLSVIDGDNREIRRATRREVHENFLLHREVYAYLINSKKQLLLQQRSDNNLWDHAVGGHFPFNQNYLQAAQREFQEELGVNLGEKEFSLLGICKILSEHNNRREQRLAGVFFSQKRHSIKGL